MNVDTSVYSDRAEISECLSNFVSFLFPSMLGAFKIVFWPLIPVIGYRAVLGLSGYVISNVAFVLAALYFYRYCISLITHFVAY